MTPDKPSILLIYTGGTIGMAQKGEGGALSPVNFDQIRDDVPELNRLGHHLESVTFNPPIDSSDMTPQIWGRLAKTIYNNKDKFDGFVVLHGTDTMAYTASALSYMLAGFEKPVVLTGSQLPIGILRTDGRENLITSIEIAAAKHDGKAIVPEVCIYFDFKLTRGNRTGKRHSDHFSAFTSANYPLLAQAGVEIKYFRENILYPNIKRPLKISTIFDNNVVVLKLFPGMSRQIFENIIDMAGLHGVVLETFGSGNIPTLPWMMKAIRKAIRKGVIILNVTQCQGGAVKMGHYQTSRELSEAGVVSGEDMITEAAVTKLMFLLGLGLSNEEVKQQLKNNLCGEISD